MRSPSKNPHGRAHLELVSLYAMQALASSEVPAAEAQIAACEDCRQEMETLRPVIDSFVAWPTDVLRPSTSLWTRLVQRVATETGGDTVLPAPESRVEPEWEEVAFGVFCKLLASDAERSRVSMLVRLEPGVDYPSHRHALGEELYVLHGELVIDDKKLLAGDYVGAEAGTVDERVWSDTGCTCVLITSPRDTLR